MFPTTSCIFHSIDGEFIAEPDTIAVEAWFVMERLVDTLQLGPTKNLQGMIQRATIRWENGEELCVPQKSRCPDFFLQISDSN